MVVQKKFHTRSSLNDQQVELILLLEFLILSLSSVIDLKASDRKNLQFKLQPHHHITTMPCTDPCTDLCMAQLARRPKPQSRPSKPRVTDLMILLLNIHAPSMMRTWDLSICLYLNLKHSNLDHSATTVGSLYILWNKQLALFLSFFTRIEPSNFLLE